MFRFEIVPTKIITCEEFNELVRQARSTNDWYLLESFLHSDLANTTLGTQSCYGINYQELYSQWQKKIITSETHPFTHFVLASITLRSQYSKDRLKTRKSVLENIFIGLSKLPTKHPQYHLQLTLNTIIEKSTQTVYERQGSYFEYSPYFDEDSLSHEELFQLASICEFIKPSETLSAEHKSFWLEDTNPIDSVRLRERLQKKLKKLADNDIQLFMTILQKLLRKAPQMQEYFVNFLDMRTRAKVVFNAAKYFETSEEKSTHHLFSWKVKMSTHESDALIQEMINKLDGLLGTWGNNGLHKALNTIIRNYSSKNYEVLSDVERFQLLRFFVHDITTFFNRCQQQQPPKPSFSTLFGSSPLNKLSGYCQAALDVVPRELLASLQSRPREEKAEVKIDLQETFKKLDTPDAADCPSPLEVKNLLEAKKDYSPNGLSLIKDTTLPLEQLLYVAGICEAVVPINTLIVVPINRLLITPSPPLLNDVSVRLELRDRLTQLAKNDFSKFMDTYVKIGDSTKRMGDCVLRVLESNLREKVVLELNRRKEMAIHQRLQVLPKEVRKNILMPYVETTFILDTMDYTNLYETLMHSLQFKLQQKQIFESEYATSILEDKRFYKPFGEANYTHLLELVELVESTTEQCRKAKPSFLFRLFGYSPHAKIIGHCASALDCLPRSLLWHMRQQIDARKKIARDPTTTVSEIKRS